MRELSKGFKWAHKMYFKKKGLIYLARGWPQDFESVVRNKIRRELYFKDCEQEAIDLYKNKKQWYNI